MPEPNRHVNYVLYLLKITGTKIRMIRTNRGKSANVGIKATTISETESGEIEKEVPSATEMLMFIIYQTTKWTCLFVSWINDTVFLVMTLESESENVIIDESESEV
jgi:hypothetical protein